VGRFKSSRFKSSRLKEEQRFNTEGTEDTEFAEKSKVESSRVQQKNRKR
jgi:hypothetical protein